MNKFIRLIILGGIIAICLSAPSIASAQAPWTCQQGSLPSYDPKYTDDQLIFICIPFNWNGQLVMYAHGYVPEQLPLVLPLAELTMPDGTFIPNVLLTQGFAFATTSYHKNGYAVEQARKDLNDLLNHFKKLVPPSSLQKVYIVGASEGGMIATLMIEHFPEKYAGALSMCGPIGGGPYQVQYLNDFRAIFDYFFLNVFSFGVTDVPINAWEGWNPGYIQAITFAIVNNPTAMAQLYSVSGAAVDPMDPSATFKTAISILFYSIWGTNDLIMTSGGMPYDNRSTLYSGSSDDTALNDGIERVQSDPRALAYLRRFYQPTGDLQRPLVTLHNTLDPVVPFQHVYIYQDKVIQAGREDLFTPIPVPTYGHCNFSVEQIDSAFGILVQQASALP